MAKSAMSAARGRAARVLALSVAVLSLGVLAAQAAGASPAVGQRASRSAATPGAMALSAQAAGTVRQTKTIERVNLINGQNVVVDKRTVSLSVNVTKNLIYRQTITVSWTGAHPTGGIQPNPNDQLAQYQEYPMVLLECHGNASPNAPAAQQILPQDCWTSALPERLASTDNNFQDNAFPPWRLDRYATAAGQRNLTVGIPNPVPNGCTFFKNFPYYWLNYVSSSGQAYPIGPGGCGGYPSEMSALGGLGDLPSNETFAVTNVHGQGSAAFDVWTNQVNSDLGCSQQVSCALVAVPIMGISCDPSASGMPAVDQPSPGAQEQEAAQDCEQTGNYAPGARATVQLGGSGQGPQNSSVTGQFWWAASNWRNRFVVPLTFAPASNFCSVRSQRNHTVQVYGSELMDQAMLQWGPHFCLKKNPFTVNYAGESEPLAVTGLQSGPPTPSGVEAALVSNQPTTPFPEAVVHAPIAETGFAISFVIDNANGIPITTLRLDPRLLAKLLTESYPGVPIMANDPELLHNCPGVPVPGTSPPMCTNPLDITEDPEFQALNPDVPVGVGESDAASVLLALSSNSDVMRALTSYINSNPAARAWLKGNPDPWGMTVNSAYKNISMPRSFWPLLSTYYPQDWVTNPQLGPGYCFGINPSPVLPLLAAPVLDLPDIAQDIQFYLSQSLEKCNPNANPAVKASEYLVSLGQQNVGFRFMIGVTTLADAIRFGLSTASLLTYTKPGTPAMFTSANGMTFTAPTNASMRNAAGLLVSDKAAHDWTFPYDLYTKDSTRAQQAYPGAMLVYADVPTADLPKQGHQGLDAQDYSNFVDFAASAGQQPGGGVGQLPPGYLPMTAANHLGAEASYAVRAASAIAAQKGAIPALFLPKKSAKSRATSSPSPATSSAGSTSSTSSAGSATSSASSGSSSTNSQSASPSPSSSRARLALTPEANFGVGGYVLPAVAGLALLAAAGAGAFFWLTRVKGKKWWG